jgi:GDP-4-dehydro-6-deoxy-D-mannose reductase
VQKSLLLIGARGFAGVRLLEAARETGARVAAAGRESVDGTPPCDLLDSAAVEACITAVEPDLVINLAGAVSVARSWEQPGEAYAVNAVGVLNLLEAVARRAPSAHVLCVSSAEVYGESGTEAMPLAEGQTLRPITPYGAGKAAMELLCGQYSRGRGLRIGVARAFNLIGPGQSPRFAASSFARRIAEAERNGAGEVELALGNPGAVRDFTDVRDAARALLDLSRRELCGTYNVCSGRAVTIADLVAALAPSSALAVTARQDPDLKRPADPAALVGDPSRLREATGYAAEIPLSQTLADLLDWWRQELAGD